MQINIFFSFEHHFSLSISYTLRFIDFIHYIEEKSYILEDCNMLMKEVRTIFQCFRSILISTSLLLDLLLSLDLQI
jgi:hypothetical protein